MTSDLTDGIDSLSKKKVESGRKIICREMESILISRPPQEAVEIIKSKEKITLVENDEIISSNIQVAKTFQNFCSSIVKNLNIQRDETHLFKTT